jgi:hypothetical protein
MSKKDSRFQKFVLNWNRRGSPVCKAEVLSFYGGNCKEYDVTTYSLVETNRRYGRTGCLHLQGRNEVEHVSKIISAYGLARSI